jgi:hypothetical protein
MTRPTFRQACSQYVHRYTMDHVPAWARVRRDDGTYYAPQYASDLEWYENTLFPGEAGHIGDRNHCYSTGCTWPLGQSIPGPYSSQTRRY